MSSIDGCGNRVKDYNCNHSIKSNIVSMYGCQIPENREEPFKGVSEVIPPSGGSGVPVLISQVPGLERAIETVLEFLNKKTMIRGWIKNTITLSLFEDLSEDKDIKWCESKAEEILQVILGGKE